MTHDEKPDHPTQATDRLLTEAGARWRASQPEPGIMQVEDLVTLNTPRSRRATLAAAATVVALFVGLTIAQGEPADRGHRPADHPDPEPTLPLVVREGGSVSAYGYVIAPAGEKPRLCQYLEVPAGGPDCQGLSVPLGGLRLTDLPSPRVDGRTTVSSEAWIRGIYQAGELRVEEVRPAQVDQLPPRVVPPPPCDAPPNGWEAMPRFRPKDWRPYDPRLEAFLRSHANVYSGVWTTVADYYYNTPVNTVTVVGTTDDDIAAARAELARYVPTNLCVHHARFSQKALDGVRAKLSAQLPGAKVTADPVTDTVEVRTVAYDELTHDVVRTADPDMVTVVTLLRPLD